MAALTFEGDALIQVAKTARTHGKKVYLVKDDGIYLCVHAPGAKKGTICYAKGYDPAEHTGNPGYLHEICSDAIGGDDFGEALPATAFASLSEPGFTLKIRLSAKSMSVTVLAPPASPEQRRTDLAKNMAKNGLVIQSWINDDHLIVKNEKSGRVYEMKKGRGRMWNAVPGTVRAGT